MRFFNSQCNQCYNNTSFHQALQYEYFPSMNRRMLLICTHRHYLSCWKIQRGKICYLIYKLSLYYYLVTTITWSKYSTQGLSKYLMPAGKIISQDKFCTNTKFSQNSNYKPFSIQLKKLSFCTNTLFFSCNIWVLERYL